VSSRKFSKTQARLWRVEAGGSAEQATSRPARAEARADVVATEEPLEIRLRWGGTSTRTVAVTMRTPGADRELAAGFLFAEGVIASAAEIARITPLLAGPGGVGLTPGPSYVPAAFSFDPTGSGKSPAKGATSAKRGERPGSAGSLGASRASENAAVAKRAGSARASRASESAATAGALETASGANTAEIGETAETAELEAASACSNVLEVELAGEHAPELASLERHFFATSACGVCGKAGLETLRLRVSAEMPPGPRLAPALIASLPAKLRAAQGLFDATGGLHAAALFDSQGELLAVREDVGRHNALDKLVGWALLAGRLPLHDHVLLVSGRTSYEILQKSVVAGLPVVCAISAPSSLAVELALRFGVTLIGFLRGERCNVYSGIERIAVVPAEPVEWLAAAGAGRIERSDAGGHAGGRGAPSLRDPMTSPPAEPRQRRRERFPILPASAGGSPGAHPARRRPL
jgi:formate dehydrogenase accessory protein FdhD